MDCSLYQSSPTTGFFRQEYWSGLSFPSPGDLPDPGIEPRSSTLQADALPFEPFFSHLDIWGQLKLRELKQLALDHRASESPHWSLKEGRFYSLHPTLHLPSSSLRAYVARFGTLFCLCRLSTKFRWLWLVLLKYIPRNLLSWRKKKKQSLTLSVNSYSKKV